MQPLALDNAHDLLGIPRNNRGAALSPDYFVVEQEKIGLWLTFA